MGYTVMKSLADQMLAFVPLLCFTDLDRSDTVPHVSFVDLIRFTLNKV